VAVYGEEQRLCDVLELAELLLVEELDVRRDCEFDAVLLGNPPCGFPRDGKRLAAVIGRDHRK
jgi:hypothetical protein